MRVSARACRDRVETGLKSPLDGLQDKRTVKIVTAADTARRGEN
jgi:hypothetical protein